MKLISNMCSCLKRFAWCGPILSASAMAVMGADQPPTLRLPGSVVPVGYQAALTLVPGENRFSGTMRIQVSVKQAVSTIWLNGTQLEISQAKLTRGSKSWSAKPLANGNDFIGLVFDSAVSAGDAELEIVYRGQVRSRDSSGVFQMEDNGNRFLFTQFESTDARAAFPCFDEPSYKVPWQLTLTVPQDDDAVSNSPVEKQESAPRGQKVLHFRQTKPLPSYLVAFAVGKFDFVPAGFAGRNRAPVQIVTPRGHAREAKYAAEVTATILTRLEDYFGIPFPYEKSDQLAIPSTYGFGAMENAGLVTYAQTILLADPDRDTAARQRTYASVAAHELAHQWFGDLVTTAWWNDIWLNEAFASWMEEKLIADWQPEWQTRVADVNSKLGAEREDTLLSARKIRQEIESKDDISNAFDGITYEKGAAVIGMFESWMGAAAFRQGVQAYLHKYAFKNATAPEFLAAVSAGGGKQITQPFLTFLNQPGVPLVSIALDCKGSSTVLHLAQQRSLPMNTRSTQAHLWQIPVCVRYGQGVAGESACTLLSDPRTDWKIESKGGCPSWIEANNDAVGYYRVLYAGNLLASLTEGDVARRLSAPERVELIGNAQALASTGQLAESDVLRMVGLFHADPNRFVVERAIRVAEMPREQLVPTELEPNYQRFILKNFQARAHALGWLPRAGESDDERLLRPSLLPFVATDGGDGKLANQARELTQQWFVDHNAISANVAGAVLATAAYGGDRGLFNQFLAKFQKTQDRQERRLMISAMASFRDPSAIRAGMEAVLRGEVPFIEGMQLLLAGQRSLQTRKIAFDFMKQNFTELSAKRPTGGGADAGARFVEVGRSFCDAASESDLKTYFEPRINSFVGAPRLLAQTLEEVESCIANKAKQGSSVGEFLKGF